MGIGSVVSFNPMSGTQMTMSGSADTKSKSIQKEITNVQQQMQKLSSKEEFSVSEKANERKKLQKEISGLNVELKQHQEELLKTQKREMMLAKLREEMRTSADKEEQKDISAGSTQTDRQGTVLTKNSDGTVILKEEMNGDVKTQKDTPEETRENIDADMSEDSGLSPKEMHTMVSADHSLQRAGRQGVVIARIKDGVAIFKGEIEQDERYGADTEKKQAEFEKMEERERRAMKFQSSALGEANSTVRSAAKAKVSGAKETVQETAQKNVVKLFEEDRAAKQRFTISFGS